MGSKKSYPKYIIVLFFNSFLSFLFLLYSDLGSRRVPKKMAWAPGAVVNGTDSGEAGDPGTGDAILAHHQLPQGPGRRPGSFANCIIAIAR